MTKRIEPIILKVGSEGEIIPPKAIREELRLEPNSQIILTIQENQLIIRKVHQIEEILKSPPKMKISYRAWKLFKQELSEEYEN